MSAEEVVRELKRRGETLAFCESLSAGLASATVANVPGASAVLRGGLITYATDLKVSLAHVPQELVDKHTVVSPEVAAAMAQGAQEVCESTWVVALTGVAGPDPQDGHPVGEVYVACAGPNGVVAKQAENIDSGGGVLVGDRNAIRAQAVECALKYLLDSLD